MARQVTLDILDRIQIASPCPVRWEDMAGDDRRRHCSQCNLHVYNLSALSREEAVDLVTRAEGRLCAGFWRRADGTVLTQDCPVGVRARAAAAARRVAAAVALVIGAGLMIGASKGPGWRLRNAQPFVRICEWMSPPRVTPRPGPAVWTAGVVMDVPPPRPANPAPKGPAKPSEPARSPRSSR